MNHYVERKDQSWGTYDYVDHGHDNRMQAPGVDLMGVGDYETSSPVIGYGKTAPLGAEPASPSGFDLSSLASAASALVAPVVRNGLQYVDPSLAPYALSAMRAAAFNPGPDGFTGTLTPLLPGAGIRSWAEEAAAAGGAALIELPAQNPFSIRAARVFDPNALADLAGKGGAFAILAIDPKLESEAAKLAESSFPWGPVIAGVAVVGSVGLIFAIVSRGRK